MCSVSHLAYVWRMSGAPSYLGRAELKVAIFTAVDAGGFGLLKEPVGRFMVLRKVVESRVATEIYAHWLFRYWCSWTAWRNRHHDI